MAVGGNHTLIAMFADMPNGSTDFYEAYGFLDNAAGNGTVQGAQQTFFKGKAI